MILLKAALAGVTLLLLASAGGGFILVPALLPLHLWAARHSGRFGRTAWALAAGKGLAMGAWLIVYRILGERQPFIWLLPTMVGMAGVSLFLRACTHQSPERVRSG